MTALGGWENFYVIAGSSAGALIGLQFVVITLIGDAPSRGDQQTAVAGFATPTIVHFFAVLLLACILSAPWESVHAAAIAWGVMGAAGVGYEFIVVRRMRRQNVYKPVFEDWLFHVLLPAGAYLTLPIAAYASRGDARDALFAVAGAALMLLFVGIHNAWDAITYHVVVARARQHRNEPRRD